MQTLPMKQLLSESREMPRGLVMLTNYSSADPNRPLPQNKTVHGRVDYPSFAFNRSFTMAGLAWPREAFMTWPTRKPIT